MACNLLLFRIIIYSFLILDNLIILNTSLIIQTWYNKILVDKILFTNKRNVKSKLVFIISIRIAIVLVITLLILSIPIEKELANPCSHNAGYNGGPGGSSSGTGNTGSTGAFGTKIGSIGLGLGGSGGNVAGTFNGDVITTKAFSLYFNHINIFLFYRFILQHKF